MKFQMPVLKSIVLLLCFFFKCLVSASPVELKNPVIYGVVPAFFGAEPLKSVTARLDELKDLGVDILWISPLQESDDSGVINYSVTDYFKLRKDFGSEKDLKDLVKKAHQLGLKVIIDFVPNHSSKMHPYFLDAEARGTDSPYFDFYDRDSEGNHTYYFDWDYLPNLNYRNPAVQAMIESALIHWIKTYSLDGFRMDVAWGLKERAPEAWPRMIQNLKGISPDLIFLAEAPAHDSYYFSSGFHWGYDWGKDLGVWAWKDVFDENRGLSGRLQQALSTSQSPGVVRFLNNNDTGKRFITRYGIKKYQVASVLQHTLPGAALLYSGDEIGAEFEPYEDPPPIKWEDERGLTPFFKNLIRVRKSVSAFQSDAWFPLPSDRDGAVFGYLRGEGPAQVLVLLNFGLKSSFELDRDFSALSPALEQADRFQEALSGQMVRPSGKVGSKTRFSLPAHSALILRPADL